MPSPMPREAPVTSAIFRSRPRSTAARLSGVGLMVRSMPSLRRLLLLLVAGGPGWRAVARSGRSALPRGTSVVDAEVPEDPHGRLAASSRAASAGVASPSRPRPTVAPEPPPPAAGARHRGIGRRFSPGARAGPRERPTTEVRSRFRSGGARLRRRRRPDASTPDADAVEPQIDGGGAGVAGARRGTPVEEPPRARSHRRRAGRRDRGRGCRGHATPERGARLASGRRSSRSGRSIPADEEAGDDEDAGADESVASSTWSTTSPEQPSASEKPATQKR